MKGAYAFLLLAAHASAQTTLPKPTPQTTFFNSSFKFSPEQIKLGQLSADLAQNLETIINWDRSQLAHGGPSQDDFYHLGNIPTPHSPGQVLKVQHVTDPSEWNIPAATALSRFIYTTTNANGTLIPASAYILWPWTPKEFGNNKSNGKAPSVLWSHGTSGYFADGSPSAHRSLFYGDIMPYTLAQAGYAVVASDYAGLGVEKSWDGSYVPHQYQSRLPQAYDSLNALRAARKIFPQKLTNEYVNVGHSQGGAAAWGVSEVLAENADNNFGDLERDYLGSVIFAPGIGALLALPQIFAVWIGKDLQYVYPDFKLSDWLLPLGIERTKLLTQIQGGQYVSEVLVLANATEILNPAWNETYYAKAYNRFSGPGDRPFKGPMILFQGTADMDGATLKGSLAAFESTCKNHPSGSFEYVTLPGVSHFGSMESTRHQWLQWIDDRFNKNAVASHKCTQSTLKSFLPVGSYQKTGTSFPQWAGAAGDFYELVAGGF